MTKSQRTAAILVAAGRGLRAGAGGPKQYRSIGGQTVIFRAMEPFCRHPDVFAVQPVLNPDDTDMFNAATSGLRHQPPTKGGATRQASVHAGLEAIAPERPDIVLIHDAARPFVSPALISRAIDAVARTGAAIPAILVADTVKLVSANGDIEATPERARLRIAQTPQVFRIELLKAAFESARKDEYYATDESSLVERLGHDVAIVRGSDRNIKITRPSDLTLARVFLEEEMAAK